LFHLHGLNTPKNADAAREKQRLREYGPMETVRSSPRFLSDPNANLSVKECGKPKETLDKAVAVKIRMGQVSRV